MQPVKRTILVTGASSGIGRSCAVTLLNQGHDVIGLSRNCKQFIHAHPRFTSVECDLSDLTALADNIKRISKQYPAINSIIFSAGKGQFSSLEEFSYSQIQELMNLNFISQSFLARGFLPALKRKPLADLIFIGSEAALTGSRKGSIYCASKFALRGFSQALRDECAKSSVRVSLINPGMVKTDFFQSLNFEPGEHLSQHLLAEDVAEAVSYIINARGGIIIDEINLNPANHVIQFKK
ncbi:3-hydroxy acid dehydrogenase/malonic semialdehyde reductase [Bathymodiolus japonicus methanotrophic gill symbiont]|uniref:SDR family oxidoreductase n=1 Tax=Bathymodiolus japonicus methanotrophic gill symbiont TaxID=113269 RepID=UPI001B5D0304|nr:SDR family oxidoreductase [Bathymodiolus japonicus methanotrophic gill symbiont]GFO71882.1 3-hydroxy acid dehydrogenase/malonic semialdehyde reductase [Bathymodiolus japonicus methanotrophic gill symbiont]